MFHNDNKRDKNIRDKKKRRKKFKNLIAILLYSLKIPIKIPVEFKLGICLNSKGIRLANSGRIAVFLPSK